MKKTNLTRPLFTNASINRAKAGEMYKAGMSVETIARAFPEVFGVDKEGGLFIKYDYEFSDGAKETNRMITSEATSKAIKKYSI